MPKQTLYFTNPSELSLSNGQLKIRLSDEREHLRPIEDIRILIVDHHSVHLTVPLLTKLSENNVSVVFCNESHIPVSMTMDLDANCRQTKFFRGQLEAGLPLKKQIWKQIVEHKIGNQARLLDKLGMDGSRLKPSYSNVRSGDSSNREGCGGKGLLAAAFRQGFCARQVCPAAQQPAQLWVCVASFVYGSGSDGCGIVTEHRCLSSQLFQCLSVGG